MFRILEVSRLLVQAAQSQNPEERKRIVARLDAMNATLNADLAAVEAAIGGGNPMETVALRAAVAAVRRELAALRDEQRPLAPVS